MEEDGLNWEQPPVLRVGYKTDNEGYQQLLQVWNSHQNERRKKEQPIKRCLQWQSCATQGITLSLWSLLWQAVALEHLQMGLSSIIPASEMTQVAGTKCCWCLTIKRAVSGPAPLSLSRHPAVAQYLHTTSKQIVSFLLLWYSPLSLPDCPEKASEG